MTDAQPILSADEVHRLIALVERQAALFHQLETFGQRQATFIAEGEADSLLSLLAQRQQVIDRLQGVNSELEPFRRRWQELWAGLDAADQERVGALVRDAQETLEKVMAADERDRRQLEVAQRQVAQELGRVQQSGAARQAYHQTGGYAGRRSVVAPVREHRGENRFTDKLG